MLDITSWADRRSIRAWVGSKQSTIAQVPRAAGTTRVHADGGDVDRILLYGPGLSVGWGATSHSDALGGNLARALSDLTSRGTDVDVVPLPSLRIADATADLRTRKLWRFDVIVLTLGIPDALDLESARTWSRELSRLLAEVVRLAAHGSRVVLVGMESVTSLSAFQGDLAAKADRAGAALNAASAIVTDSFTTVRFVALEAGSADYPLAAEQLADALLDDLNAAREAADSTLRGPAGQNDDERERERQEGVDSVAIVDTPDEDRFDRIVTMARQLYGTSGAAFAVVDRNRVWHKSRTPGLALEVPRNQSFCSTTILHRGPHVVPDMLEEAAPDDTATADELGIRFYAGYPVEAPNGEQIGALCIFDEKPRQGEVFDEAMLRQLALLIQAELSVEALTR